MAIIKEQINKMHQNMNRKFTYILTLGLLLLSSAAMAQRETTSSVSVGGSVFGGGKSAMVGGNCTVLIDQDNALIKHDVYGGGEVAKVNTNDGTSLTQGKSTQVTLRKGIVKRNVYGGGLGERPEGESEGTKADVLGPVTVTINGGKVEGSVFGCNNLYGAPKSTVQVNVLKDPNNVVMEINNVYGGGNLADYEAPAAPDHNYPVVNVKHGTVGGSVFGGGYGASAEVTGNPQVFIGDDNANHEAVVSGNVYGGGDQAAVSGYTLVTVQNANSQVVQDVFGGGNQADVSGSDTVNIISGRVGRDVYGGGALANVGTNNSNNTVVNVLGGTVTGNVYGGGLGRKEEGEAGDEGYVSPIAAAVKGVVKVNIGELLSVNDDGYATSVNGTATIGGSVFGCNNTNGSPEDDVFVNIYKTHRETNQQTSGNGYAIAQVFGGGNQASYQPTSANKKTTVHVWTCDNTIQYLYGGGNAADVGTSSVNSATNLIIDGGRIQWVFGGGNGASTPTFTNPGANIFGDANVTFHSGEVYYLFGGSNERGSVSNDKNVNIRNDGPCEIIHIVELYGGNNKAETVGNVSLTMDCPEGGSSDYHKIDYVFGGSRDADITGNVELTINGGEYDYVFGGNNMGGIIGGNVTLNLYGGKINEAAFGGNKGGGSINGNITVVVEDAENSCPLELKDVFGAGDQAKYTAPSGAEAQDHNPVVYINHLRENYPISGNVYGGGNGDPNVESQEPGMVTGHPEVIIGDDDEDHLARISGNVYGGGNAAKVVGPTTVLMQNGNSTVGHDIYGGGNLAHVSGSTTVDVNDGEVTQDVYGGGALANTGGSTVTLDGGTVRNLYGGGLGQNGDNTANPPVSAIAAQVTGAVKVTVNSGSVTDVYGCNNINGAPTNTVQVDINSNVIGNVYGGGNQASGSVSPVVNIKGGTVGVNVFGGGYGESATVTGAPEVNLIGGSVTGKVFGGGSAAPVVGDPTVNVNSGSAPTIHGGGWGGTAIVTGDPTVIVSQTSGEALSVSDVFGGGDAAGVTGNTNVQLQAGSVANIYGGGNQAGVTQTTSVSISGGNVTTGGVYGGCNSSGVVGGTATIDVTGGTVGTAAVGVEGDDDYVPEVRANIYGGGKGTATRMSGNVAVNVGETDGEEPPTYSGDAVIYGDVYGGSAQGKTNCNEAGTEHQGNTKTDVILYAGTIHGDLYGGGHGIDNAIADVYGPVQVTVNGGTVTGSVYGCNNANGAPQSTVKVDIYGTDEPESGYALHNVFGGGNQAAYSQTPVVKVHNCDNSIEYVYGGGNAASVNGTDVTVYGGTINYVFGGGNGVGVAEDFEMVATTASTKIHGGTIGHVFAGNNTRGVITGAATLDVNKQAEVEGGDECDMFIGEVYGGGNLASGKAGKITIGCTGELVALGEDEHYGVDHEGIRYVYGGANQAGISNNITLDINSGIVENVFGGNNTDGAISGTITVNIKKTGTCDWYVGDVYGGGNLAAYSPTNTTNNPAVNIKNGTVSGNVFGGGLGTSAKVRSNPKVIVGDLENEDYAAVIAGNVYGGGSAAMVGDDDSENPSVNNTTVLVQHANSSVAKVFGGGMAAGVTGTSTVTVADGSVTNSIFGGCDTQGTVSGDIVVNVTGGEIGTHDLLYANTPVVAQVFGGGYGHETSTGGNVTVNIGTDNDNHSETPKIWGDVYGGSAEGNVNPEQGESTTTLHIYNGTLESNIIQDNAGFNVYNGGNVYGGGLGTTAHPAAVFGTVNVNIGASHTNSDPTGAATIKGNVYGCNNAKGTPKKDVTVNVYKTYQSGSNAFDYVPTPEAPATYAIANVFGGGNEADYEPGSDSNKASVNIIGCSNTIERVFGGGNAAAAGTTDHPIDGVFSTIDGGRIDQVFGGGNGEVSPANINGDVNLAIHGGSVNQFFVGSNQQGSVSGESSVTADNSSCPFVIDEFFCGGNYAPIHGNVITTIECGSNVANMQINNLYGGCNMADILDDEDTPEVEGNVQLTVRGGSYNNIYGGSKGSPAPTGSNVTEEELDAASADISGNVTLNIYGGKVTEAIYGGSNVNGSIGGNITVTIENQGGDCPLDVDEADVYGAGNLAIYTAPSGTGAQANNPMVYINHAEVKNVFGGGKGDEQVNTQVPGMVTGNPKVFIGDSNGSHTAAVTENVYGGGNAAKVVGATTVVMQNGNSPVAKDIYGGGNLANVTGATTVDVNNGAVTQDVYGGGALANTNGSNVTLGGGTVRDIYGGGLGDETHPAEVSGAVQVTVNNGSVTNVFGCNNVKGAPTSTVRVDINNNIGGSVYGGGNQAACSVNPTVYINKGVVSGNVFGGGLGNSAVVTGTPSVTVGDLTEGHGSYVATVNGDVYGGGDAANVQGTTSVLVQKCNTVINGDVYGGGNAAHIVKNNGTGGSTSVNITGGLINSSNPNHGNVFGGGHGDRTASPEAVAANVEGNTSVDVNGGTIKRVFGGSNSKGDIGDSTSVTVEKESTACDLHITEVYGGGNLAEGKAGQVTIGCTGTGTDDVIEYVYGGANNADVTGDIELNIVGGRINNVFGGNNNGGEIDGTITVNINWDDELDCGTDGKYLGNVYGGGNVAAYSSPLDGDGNRTAYPEVNILNGTVSTNVFGGGLGQQAKVTANPVVNINGGTVTGKTFGGGSAAPVKGNPTVNAKKGNATTVFGGGWGATAVVTGDPTVVVNQTSGESLNVTDVYGGGDQAEVEGSTDVQLKNGTVTNAFGGGNKASINGSTSISLEGATASNLYGGGNEAGVTGTTSVSVSSGNAITGVYGGCNTTGTVQGKATVDVVGGTIGAAAVGTEGEDDYVPEQRANIYGGGKGTATRMSGNVAVNVGETDGEEPPTYSGDAVIYGDVYGGSAQGKTNCNEAGTGHQSNTKTDVTLYAGTIHGDFYGGGHGIDNAIADVYGPVQVTVNGGTVTGSVYGCNNANGAPQSTVKVDIYGTDVPESGFALHNVFGGGNQAAYSQTPVVKVHNCNNSIEYVYGGGNAATVKGTDVTIYGGNTIDNVFGGCYGSSVTTDGTDVKIYGGKIGHVYGGNNVSGTITGNIKVNVNNQAEEEGEDACTMKIGEVYGGGNVAGSNAGEITIGCTGTGDNEGIDYVYGGANQAPVTGPIVLTIQEGRIGNVFGGNNNGGAITGDITVNIEKKAHPCVWEIGNVFGGGNLAQYNGTPKVYVKNGAVANVYGGGNGNPQDQTQEPGQVTGTDVTIGDDNEDYSAIVTGNVYGGGNAARVSGNTKVVYNDNHITSYVGNLFGGGNQAGVTGTAQVTLTDGTVTTGMYGGCNEKGNIVGNITVNVNGGTIGSSTSLASYTTADVFGGGYGKDTGTSGDVEVNVNGGDIYGDVYGGSALGNVNNEATDKTTVNILDGTLHSEEETITGGFKVYHGGNVYGGGLGRKAVGEEGDEGYVSPIAAAVNGLVTVNIGSGVMDTEHPQYTSSTSGNATIQGNVYGCNNANGSPQQNVTVNIYQTAHPDGTGVEEGGYALANVFGGGNEANFQIQEKTATVNIYGCDNTIRRTFGGSNAAASDSVFTMIQGGHIHEAYGGGNGEIKPADVNGNVTLAIHGGNVDLSFGGSNQQGTISGHSKVTIDSEGGCGESEIEEFFCGGNFADYYGDIDATIDCADGLHIHNLYGGCKQADVLPTGNQVGNVHLVVNGGTYENIYGGSQGRLAGTDPQHPDAESADINGSILLEINGGKVTNAVYGGSHYLGVVKGTITVNVENKDPDCPLDLSAADVYGGGNQADYPGLGVTHTAPFNYPQVNIKNATVKNVFGGGLKAKVIGNPQIRIKKGTRLLGNVYGGGNLGEVEGNPRVIVNGNDDSENPHEFPD